MNPSLISLKTNDPLVQTPVANAHPLATVKRVGLIAGWGDFPVVVAKTLHEAGIEVYCAMLHGHADERLEQYCTKVQWSGVTRLSCKIRFFKQNQVEHVTMAGKLFKTIMFQRFAWLRHIPDLRFIKYFYHHFMTNKAGRADDELLLTVVKIFQDVGMHMAAATDFAPQLLIGEGILTRNDVSDYTWQDIAYGWHLAKEMGRLDIGQTVVVRGRAVVAVEALEGTDQCIKRAGDLCPVGGFAVVKVAKPQQDMRFDVPTIGIKTLQNIQAAGGKVLAIEADKTIVLNQEEVVQFANSNGMSIVAIGPEQLQRLDGFKKSA